MVNLTHRNERERQESSGAYGIQLKKMDVPVSRQGQSERLVSFHKPMTYLTFIMFVTSSPQRLPSWDLGIEGKAL